MLTDAVRFLVGLAAGALGLLAGLALLFVALDLGGALKAPSFTNRLTFDEKLRHLRDNLPHGEVELLLVGSSAAAYGFDGDVLRETLREDVGVLNGGVPALQVNQVRFLTNFFLDHLPGVGRAVMISTIPEFWECRPEDAAFFDPEHVADYAFGQAPELYYQFKYFDPIGVLEKARHIEGWRRADDTLEAVSFDRDGSLLLDVPRHRLPENVWLGDPIRLNLRCYEALRGLSLDLRAAGVPFTYVLAPMRPGYLDLRDPTGRLLAEHRRRLRASLAGTGAAFVDAHAVLALPKEDFFDAYHLERDAVPALTRLVAEVIEDGGGGGGGSPTAAAGALDRSGPRIGDGGARGRTRGWSVPSTKRAPWG